MPQIPSAARGRAARCSVALTVTAVLALLLGSTKMANAQSVFWEATLRVETSGSWTGYRPSTGIGSLSAPTFGY